MEGWSFVNVNDQGTDFQRQQNQLMVNEEQFVGKAKSGTLAKKRGSGSQTVVYATNASKKEVNE